MSEQEYKQKNEAIQSNYQKKLNEISEMKKHFDLR